MRGGPILLIDDSPASSRFIAGVLRGQGLPVFVATSLARGLELAEGTELGLVILALLTPFATGAAIVEAVRRALPEQPLLIVSARSDADAKVRCLELGATDFLARPFAAAELVARVHIQLRRHAAAPVTTRR